MPNVNDRNPRPEQGPDESLTNAAAQLRRAIDAGTAPPKAAAELAALLDKLIEQAEPPVERAEKHSSQEAAE